MLGLSRHHLRLLWWRHTKAQPVSTEGASSHAAPPAFSLASSCISRRTAHSEHHECISDGCMSSAASMEGRCSRKPRQLREWTSPVLWGQTRCLFERGCRLPVQSSVACDSRHHLLRVIPPVAREEVPSTQDSHIPGKRNQAAAFAPERLVAYVRSSAPRAPLAVRATVPPSLLAAPSARRAWLKGAAQKHLG